MTRTASLSTVAWRARPMEDAVRSILPQVDRLNVFLQGYTEVPSILFDPKIAVLRDVDEPKSYELRATAKFHWFYSGLVDRGYHFTIDDDIVYPPDYVDYCVRRIDHYGHRAAVGFHGALYPGPVNNFFRDRQCWRFAEACPVDAHVQMIGTGTLAHHTSTFNLSIDEFEEPNSCDVWFAIAMQRRRVPLVCLARPAGYLTYDKGANADSRSVSSTVGQSTRQAEFFNRWKDWQVHRGDSAMPSRSVVAVIPYYGEDAPSLKRSIDSALATSGIDQVIAVDDGSPEPLTLVMDRVHVIRRDTSEGPGAAINTAIHALPSDAIVCRLDCRDTFIPEPKARQIEAVKSGACQASFSWYRVPGTGTNVSPAPNWRKRMFVDNQFCGTTAVFTKAAWQAAGGYPDSIRWGEDWWLAVMIEHMTGWIEFPEVTGEHGQHAGGLSDVDEDPERQAARDKDLKVVRERAKILGNPAAFAHFFSDKWCLRKGIRPIPRGRR